MQGRHRKDPRVRPAVIVAGLVAAGVLAGVFVPWPAPATVAAATASVAQRPVWDGRTPAVWVGAADPVCPASVWHAGIYGPEAPAPLYGLARSDVHGPVFPVECEPDGGEYVWAAVPRGD